MDMPSGETFISCNACGKYHRLWDDPLGFYYCEAEDQWHLGALDDWVMEGTERKEE